MIERVTVPGAIDLDQLRGSHAPAQVMRYRGDMRLSADGDVPREPHRHDYHELFLVTAGTTEHRIDGEAVTVGAGQVLMIGRGQVHTLVGATDVEGAVVRFAEELLDGAGNEAAPGWLLVACATRVLEPPARELDHALVVLDVLADELGRPPDRGTDRIVAASLAMVLALLQRWQAGSAIDGPASASSPDVELLRQFVRLLEAEHHRRHDAAWYADQLSVSANHLAAVLTRLTGRSTKRLITDRLMTEVARLLRFTDLTVQQVAHRLGYDDPLYLSRAFKAHAGVAPTAWRDAARR